MGGALLTGLAPLNDEVQGSWMSENCLAQSVAEAARGRGCCGGRRGEAWEAPSK